MGAPPAGVGLSGGRGYPGGSLWGWGGWWSPSELTLRLFTLYSRVTPGLLGPYLGFLHLLGEVPGVVGGPGVGGNLVRGYSHFTTGLLRPNSHFTLRQLRPSSVAVPALLQPYFMATQPLFPYYELLLLGYSDTTQLGAALFPLMLSLSWRVLLGAYLALTL